MRGRSTGRLFRSVVLMREGEEMDLRDLYRLCTSTQAVHDFQVL